MARTSYVFLRPILKTPNTSCVILFPSSKRVGDFFLTECWYSYWRSGVVVLSLISGMKQSSLGLMILSPESQCGHQVSGHCTGLTSSGSQRWWVTNYYLQLPITVTSIHRYYQRHHTPSGGGANLSDVSCHRLICKIVRIFGPVHILQPRWNCVTWRPKRPAD